MSKLPTTTQIHRLKNFELLDDLLTLHSIAANEITLISEIPGIIHKGNITIAPMARYYCEELAFPDFQQENLVKYFKQ